MSAAQWWGARCLSCQSAVGWRWTATRRWSSAATPALTSGDWPVWTASGQVWPPTVHQPPLTPVTYYHSRHRRSVVPGINSPTTQVTRTALSTAHTRDKAQQFPLIQSYNFDDLLSQSEYGRPVSQATLYVICPPPLTSNLCESYIHCIYWTLNVYWHACSKNSWIAEYKIIKEYDQPDTINLVPDYDTVLYKSPLLSALYTNLSQLTTN